MTCQNNVKIACFSVRNVLIAFSLLSFRICMLSTLVLRFCYCSPFYRRSDSFFLPRLPRYFCFLDCRAGTRFSVPSRSSCCSIRRRHAVNCTCERAGEDGCTFCPPPRCFSIDPSDKKKLIIFCKIYSTEGHTFRPTPNCTSADPSQKVLFVEYFKKSMLRPQQKYFASKILGPILCMVTNLFRQKKVSI